MNPEDVMKDAAIVLEYALEKFMSDCEQPKVIVHGESLGGVAASFVAKKVNKLPVDFVFMNRTFASIERVTFWGAGIATMMPSLMDPTNTSTAFCFLRRETYSRLIGSLISKIMLAVTGWKDSNLQNFLGIEKSSSKYILYGADSVNDNIIFDLASLKNAIANHFVSTVDSEDIQKWSQLFMAWHIKFKNTQFLITHKAMEFELATDVFPPHLLPDAQEEAPVSVEDVEV